MTKIGTYQWAQVTQGKLSSQEKIAIVSMMLRSQFEEQIQKLRYKLGGGKEALARVDFEKIVRPDSRIARRAEEMCQDLHTSNFINHCYRTYYWASLLGQVDNLSVDVELLYVGCLLHDMGLTETHNPKAAHGCFALNGGDVAYTLAQQYDWTAERCETLYNTIGLHINPQVKVADHGPEAKLLSNGAFMDIVGLRHYCLTRAAILEVQNNHPRETFIREILALMKAIPHSKNTRSEFMSHIGIDWLALRNPLEKIAHQA